MKIGITCANFNFSGWVPFWIQILIILLRGIEIAKLIILRISVGIPFGPVPFEDLSSAISKNTSLGVQRSYAKDELLRFLRYLSNVLRIGVLLFSKILSATVEI